MVWLLMACLPWLIPSRVGPRPPHAPSESLQVDEVIVAQCAVALLQSGMPISRMLQAIGEVMEEPHSHGYGQVSDRLDAGHGWKNAWEGITDPYRLEPALRAAWLEGIDPTAALQYHIDHTVRMRVNEAKTQAAILGVRIVLPLGLCLLPAFVLLGLVPSMVSSGMNLG